MKEEHTVTGTLSWEVMYADERFSWFWPPAFDPEQEPLHVESIVALLGAQPGACLLDLACGRGWLTVPLAQRGFIVTGCDLSQAMLAQARQAAAQVDVSIAWQRADMRHLPAAWAGRFDYVIHTLSEFGCFAEEAENQLVLAEVARVLKPGGRYLLDVVVNRDGWLVRGWSSGWLEGAGFRVREEYSYDLVRGIQRRRYRWDAGQGPQEYEWQARMYTPTEVVRMLEAADFRLVAAYGSLTGAELTRESTGITLVAEK